MLIDLRELLSSNDSELKKTFKLETSIFDLGRFKYDISDSTEVEVHLTKLSKNSARVKFSGTVTLIVACDRCLKAIELTIPYSVDRVCVVGNDSEKTSIEDDEEHDYIDGYNLDIDQLCLAEVLINLPTKFLCKENCKGLCLICGNDLNIKDCGCDREVLDPRMSVFRDILKDFKEV